MLREELLACGRLNFCFFWKLLEISLFQIIFNRQLAESTDAEPEERGGGL